MVVRRNLQDKFRVSRKEGRTDRIRRVVEGGE